jgi:hypothetical protein
MIYIQHRVNTLEHLRSVPLHYGVELDLRDHGDRLILRHDPFGDGEEFEPYLAAYRNVGPMILNIKSERVELRVLELLAKHPINDYFFLDSSYPMIRLLNAKGEKKIAVRFSEFEPLEGALALAGQVDWVWVDCFTKLPLDPMSYSVLSKHFKICIVSPELQGRPKESIPAFAEQLRPFPPTAICTKSPETWQSCGGIFAEVT